MISRIFSRFKNEKRSKYFKESCKDEKKSDANRTSILKVGKPRKLLDLKRTDRILPKVKEWKKSIYLHFGDMKAQIMQQ